jgi:uncharacterized Zn-binding protein involved in type VI secretion
MSKLIAVQNATIETNHVCTSETSPDSYSEKVTIGGLQVVRAGDKTESHTYKEDSDGDCLATKHTPLLEATTSKVFCDGKLVGRQGDNYGVAEQITSAGQTRVTAG